MTDLHSLVPKELALAAILVVSACGRPAGLVEPPKILSSTVTAAPLSAWEDLVKAAQKEGTVRIYGDTALSPAMGPMRDAFKRKFGLELEYVTGRPPEVTARIAAERRAGLYLADIGHLGETSIIMDVKPLGVTASIPDLMVLPEVKDPRNWIGGKLPFPEKDQHLLMLMASAFPQLVINTDLVNEKEVTSFLDLLHPRWK